MRSEVQSEFRKTTSWTSTFVRTDTRIAARRFQGEGGDIIESVSHHSDPKLSPEAAWDAALVKRRQLQSDARAVGIDEAFLDLLVDTFYAKIRIDPDLGPIFDRVIRDAWPEHLAKMKVFWRSLALRTGEYSGNPMRTHQATPDLRPDHFARWLALFSETLEDLHASPGAMDILQTFAQSIAHRLEQARPASEPATEASVRKN